MSEIYIKLDSIDSQIEKLKELKKECEDIKAKRPVYDMEGSGDTITLLHEIDQTSFAMIGELTNLLVNSIYFFTNIRNSIQTADEKASKAMNR